jgi:microcystin-dependent protein
MATPYVGEIRMFGGNFAPAGWMFCNGQVLPISENETLFNLIGTTYGGDGEATFALPNLQSRVPIHMGTGSGGIGTYTLAQTGGVENVTLNTNQIPSHNHLVVAANLANQNTPASNSILSNETEGVSMRAPVYAPPGGTQVQLNLQTVQLDGGSQAHNNIQPILAISFIISLFGIFPTPT